MISIACNVVRILSLVHVRGGIPYVLPAFESPGSYFNYRHRLIYRIKSYWSHNYATRRAAIQYRNVFGFVREEHNIRRKSALVRMSSQTVRNWFSREPRGRRQSHTVTRRPHQRPPRSKLTSGFFRFFPLVIPGIFGVLIARPRHTATPTYTRND